MIRESRAAGTRRLGVGKPQQMTDPHAYPNKRFHPALVGRGTSTNERTDDCAAIRVAT